MEYWAAFVSIEYIVKYKFNFGLNHAFVSKWLIKTGKKTDTIDELINFVNVHAKRCNDHRRKPK